MTPPAPRTPVKRDLIVLAIAGLWLLAFGGHFFDRNVTSEVALPRIDVLAEAHWLLLDNVWPPPDEQARDSGWRYFPQRLDLLLVAGTMLLAAWSSGQLLLRTLRVEVSAGVERAVFAFGLGLSAWSLVTLGVGLAGLLSRALFVGLMLAAIAGELAARSRQRRLMPKERQRRGDRLLEQRFLGESRLPVAIVLVVAPFLLAMLLGAMLPTVDFDVKEYHLQGPREWYQQGRITFLPHNVYTSFPFLTEMLSLWGMVLRGDWFRGALIGQVVLMTFAPLSAMAVYAIGRRVSTTAGWVGVGVYLTLPWIYRISVIAYTEGALAFFLAAAFLAWLMIREETSGTMCLKKVLLNGLLAGSALACKYPGLVSVTIPIGVAVVWTAMRRAGALDVRRALRAAAVFSLGVAITFGPWALKNLVQTGNPVYPLAWTIFGGRDWTPELNDKWRSGHSPKVDWRDPADIPADLWNQVQEVAVNTPLQSPLVFGLAPLAVIAAWPLRRRLAPAPAGPSIASDAASSAPRRLVGPLILYAAWLFLTWWGLTHRIDRFWLPMLPIVCVLAGIGGALIIERLEWLIDSGRWIAGVLLSFSVAGAAVLATVYNLVVATSAQLGGFNPYLMDETAVRQLAMQQTPSIAVLAARLPEGARVLLVGEAAVFDAPFDLRYNTVFDFELLQGWATDDPYALHTEDLPLKSRDEILATLRAQGITHVFVNWMEILRYREYGSYSYTDFISPRTIRRLIELRILEPVNLAPQERLRRYEDLKSTKQQELDAWAPELKTAYGGEPAVTGYEFFRVAPE